MPLQLEDLEGKYLVTSETDYGGPFHMRGDGVTRIINGMTHRTDAAGCIWRSRFRVISDDAVSLESTCDPSDAPQDFFITDADGNPTREPVTYSSKLKVTQVDGKIQLTGLIRHHDTMTVITMLQI